MTKTQGRKEVLQVLIVLMIGVIDMILTDWVFKVYIRDTRWVLEGSRIVFSIII